jgi:uncharacterized protein (UPF0332 family)
VVRKHFDKARRSLESAGLLLDAGDFDGAVNRACIGLADNKNKKEKS